MKDLLNRLTCCSSLAMCWLTDVCRAPVQDANSLRKLSSLSMEEFNSSNRWSKRLLSPLCSREYVCATFFTRLSKAGKITYIPEQIFFENWTSRKAGCLNVAKSQKRQINKMMNWETRKGPHARHSNSIQPYTSWKTVIGLHQEIIVYYPRGIWNIKGILIT